MAEFRWEPVGVPGLTLPHVRDVGAMKANLDPFSLNPAYKKFVYWVGSDGSLWRTNRGVDVLEQVPSPGNLTGVAASPDMSVWCVDRHGRGWVMRGDFCWSAVGNPAVTFVDVDVAADGSSWFVTDDGRYFVQRTDASAPRSTFVILPISRITGIEQPDFLDSSSPAGRAWGVSPVAGEGGLMFSDGFWRPEQATITDVADLSTAPSNLWMVKTDGTVWTTTDGRTQLRMGDLIASRVAGEFADNAFAVTPDGLAWVWAIVVTPAPPSPTPPPLPPPPLSGTHPPVIAVSATGAGVTTVFTLTGSQFAAGAQVTVRGVRIGDGEIAEFYWLTMSSPTGTLTFGMPLPCLTGVVIHFSANDGRMNAADLTDRLWSNTVAADCP